ncbi:MAG: SDR family oxidoreductase [Sedimentisphaerales bacterium]|nr:SDR family oxidoreductase [Sedimentisphaerales bacterium]
MKERKAIKDRFKGKVVIVTGGSSGIGRSIVEELCKEGAAVAFTGISDIGVTTAAELNKAGFKVLFCKGDMAEEAFCRKIVTDTAQAFGKIDYLVNNAFSFNAKGLDATTEDWMRSYIVGPIGYARMVQNVVPYMQKQGGGAIVNMSSISAFQAQPNRWTYNSAKGAVNTMTKNMALDLAKYNIRVNSVSPGWIWTREVYKAADMDGGGRKKWDSIWGQYHMLERCGEPIECAGPVLFLLSDDASFITATDLPIDAGYQSMGPEGLGKTTVIAGSN